MVTQSEWGGVARRRDTGAILRRLRGESGRTEREAAEQLDCPVSRVQRIEDGLASARMAEVRLLLDLYEVPVGERAGLLADVQQARARSWWYPYSDVIDESFETQLILEDEATALRTYQPNLVPGLLQTQRYAWELITTASDLPLESVRQHASLRALRQQVLSRNGAPRFSVILDEAVLRRPVGDKFVMREQYARLASAARAPGLSVQVLPFRAGPPHALGAGFHIYEFGGDDPRMAELELLDRVQFLVGPQEVARYVNAFEHASRQALDARGSRALLEDLAAGS
jgi:transcriptional regulator with XRE-family HTH domain